MAMHRARGERRQVIHQMLFVGACWTDVMVGLSPQVSDLIRRKGWQAWVDVTSRYIGRRHECAIHMFLQPERCICQYSHAYVAATVM